MFFVYHQFVVQHLDISIFHHAMRITRWWSTYHSTQLTWMPWTFYHWSFEYGNIWRTIGTQPSYINWLMYLQFPSLIYRSIWLTMTDLFFCFTLADESIDDTGFIWTLFTHTEIYIMAIGLLMPAGIGTFCCYLFLVPTCHASMLTSAIRFCMTYYCGWWCRGSTHLQKWCKARQPVIRPHRELWSAYEMGTYIDRELTEATNTVRGSP